MRTEGPKPVTTKVKPTHLWVAALIATAITMIGGVAMLAVPLAGWHPVMLPLALIVMLTGWGTVGIAAIVRHLEQFILACTDYAIARDREEAVSVRSTVHAAERFLRDGH
ncbi:hypothetical protein [Amycolatopsis sp. YIM 10]|uniref:hypothetical protein n=1 Tax=Amycolatopsis sp. YIM 10 TaxID=2653857 RepID=UPI00128FE94C|nr:hypothetical protein [Amycolatopsis sp. YIM 10]QFU87831.1 hypothetical protein YIM_13225 [Amycolatopsis sp. YIM 10]QFU94856.1 hypothetical protein YIM_48655 [Amycolatopsis sp. YIM 10]